MNEIPLDPECTEETFHTKDFLLFNKIKKQYLDDLKTNKISSMNYMNEFLKKYLLGTELFKKVVRINEIIDRRLNNECQESIKRAESKIYFDKKDYQFNINQSCASVNNIFNVMNSPTVDIQEDMDLVYSPNGPSQLQVEHDNVCLLLTFKYRLVCDNYNNRVYKVFGLSPLTYVTFIFDHYYSFAHGRSYQYLYIISNNRSDYCTNDGKICGIVLYHNDTDAENDKKWYKTLSQFSHIGGQPILYDDMVDKYDFRFFKCKEPIFDDYNLPLIRFYDWSLTKQTILKNNFSKDFTKAENSFRFLLKKYRSNNNIAECDESRKNFLDEFFMYNRDFINDYNNSTRSNDLSTQWYTQILFSIVMDILKKNIPDFVSSRDSLLSRTETRFVKSNEVMLTDHIINSIDSYLSNS